MNFELRVTIIVLFLNLNFKNSKIMKKIQRAFTVIVLSAVLLLSSCIGSFKLTNSVYEWNKNVGDKFVNEVVFLACVIVPVYSATIFVDAVVLNSIEFWSGNNPMTMKEGKSEQKLVEIEGKIYRLSSEKYKMKIEELGSPNTATEMVFRSEDNSWYVKKGNKFQKLVEVTMKDGKVLSYQLTYPDGSVSTVNSNFDPAFIRNQIAAGQNLAWQQ